MGAVRTVLQHAAVAGAPAAGGLGAQPDQPLGTAGQFGEQIEPRIAAVGPAVAQHQHGGAAVDGLPVAVVQVLPGLAIVGGAAAHFANDQLHRVVERQALQRRLHVHQPVGESEGVQVGHRPLQRIEKHQQEAHMRRHRGRHVADHHQARLVATAGLEEQLERHAVVAGAAAQRAAEIELAVQLDAPALRMLDGQTTRHAGHRHLHAASIGRAHAACVA